MTKSRYGIAAVTAVAVLFGALVVTQYRAREVFSRTLTAESASSLTTLVASISDRNNALRDEIFALRLRVEAAQGASQSGEVALKELREQLQQLRIAAAITDVVGPGVEVRIEGPFDERALSDLVNELRNAGAEAIAVNGFRVAPRSWFAKVQSGIAIDGQAVTGPYSVWAVGAPETMAVALTRTGGIIGQLGLIYGRTRFLVSQQRSLELPAGRGGEFSVARPAR